MLGGVLLAGAIHAVSRVTQIGDGFIAGTVLPYTVGALFVTTQIGRHHPHATFGAANLVTLLRLVLTSLVAGFAVEIQLTHAVPSDAVLWGVFLVSLVTVSLDGVDGMLARRRGTSSAFGFRFDMETDAFLILMLAVAVFAVNKAGAWVLFSGLLRYLFVVAGWIWPALAAPLPPSMRRKVICVVQSLGLILPLAPVIDPPIAALIAFAALLLLVYSFAVDTLWSLRASATQLS